MIDELLVIIVLLMLVSPVGWAFIYAVYKSVSARMAQTNESKRLVP